MARRYRQIFKLIQRPANRAGSVTLVPPRQTSPWASLGHGATFPGLIERVRAGALPGREMAHVNEAVRLARETQ